MNTFQKNAFLAQFLSKILLGQKNKLLVTSQHVSNFLIKRQILILLLKEGYIFGYTLNKVKTIFNIFLKYNVENTPLVKNIFFFSKPGKKVYISKYQLKALTHSQSTCLFLLSTTKGVLTQKGALLLNVGGELLVKIS